MLVSTRPHLLTGLLLYFALADVAGAQSGYSLRMALREARENNLVLKAEKYSIDMAEADVVTAGLRPNPVLNNQALQLVSPAYFPERTGWLNGHNVQNWWQLTKVFQVAGQRANRQDFAGRNAVLAEKSYRETERNLFRDVADKWLEAWIALRQLDMLSIAKSNIDSLTYTNQVRFRNQVITQTDLFRTQVLARQYEVRYTAALQEVANRKRELQQLLGSREDIEIDTTDSFLPVFPAGRDSLLSLSLAGRSDVAVAKSEIEAAGSNIRLQKSLSYPQPELGIIWNPQNNMPYVGVYGTIDLPFFSRNQGEIRKSIIQKARAEQQLESVQRQLETEVTNALASYETHQRNVQGFQPILEQSNLILDNVKYAYLRGGTTIVDFLEAQRSWLDTRQEYYEVLQQYRRSYIELLYATGTINQLAQ